MNKFSLSALVAAGLLAGAASSASAADLGGNCCADLEERIAELEATAARKGNRKVSLTISGWVGEQITWWDDKHESNIYVTGLGQTLSSHFRFAGNAKISGDVSAGYVMHIETRTVDSLLGVNQNKDDGGNGLFVLESYWYLKSDHMGQVSVGQRSSATDNLAILTDGSGSLVQANWVLFEGAGFFLRNSTANGSKQTNFAWADGLNCYSAAATLNNGSGAGIGGDCTAAPTNNIRYDSPTFMGASLSAAYGEDDFWDIAGRWSGEHSGFKLAFAIGYSQNTDNANQDGAGKILGSGNLGLKTDQIQLGGYVQHVATGLFVHGAWLREDISGAAVGNFGFNADQAARLNALHPEMWYVKAGIRQKHFALGHTVFYGEYAEAKNKLSTAALANDFTGSNVNWWGLGLVQEIDAAAMSVWVKYRNVDGDFTLATPSAVNGLTNGKNSVDNLQMVTFGAMINF